MPREFHRSRRVAEAVHRTLGELLNTQVRDQRLSGVTVTHVEVTRDLAIAKVYYTVRGDNDDEVKEALEKATGFMRREVAREIRLRSALQLRFLRDESLERGERLSALIDAARRRDDENSDDTPDPKPADGES